MNALKNILKSHGYWLWVIPLFIILIVAWTTLISIAAKNKVKEIPLQKTELEKIDFQTPPEN